MWWSSPCLNTFLSLSSYTLNCESTIRGFQGDELLVGGFSEDCKISRWQLHLQRCSHQLIQTRSSFSCLQCLQAGRGRGWVSWCQMLHFCQPRTELLLYDRVRGLHTGEASSGSQQSAAGRSSHNGYQLSDWIARAVWLGWAVSS